MTRLALPTLLPIAKCRPTISEWMALVMLFGFEVLGQPVYEKFISRKSISGGRILDAILVRLNGDLLVQSGRCRQRLVPI